MRGPRGLIGHTGSQGAMGPADPGLTVVDANGATLGTVADMSFGGSSPSVVTPTGYFIGLNWNGTLQQSGRTRGFWLS